MIGIWLATSIGTGELIFFWPIFPILGWGMGVAFHAWNTYGNTDD
ncbi:MAG: 2TM domain-containing protein [Nitrososphaeraceae archaeon]